MIKKCRFCKTEKEMKSNQFYCGTKCKKDWENSFRSGGTSNKGESPSMPPSPPPVRPDYLHNEAAEYWDKVSPTLIERGHLNILSEDVFAELCDLVQRLRDLNRLINETNSSLLQVDDKSVIPEILPSGERTLFPIDDQGDNKSYKGVLAYKESVLSTVKRQYSKLFLEYSGQFHLTPRSNRGNFGLKSEEKKDPEGDFLKMGNK